jgi:hypothetical protein
MFTYNVYIHTYVHVTNDYLNKHVRTVLRLIQPACVLDILNLKLHVGFDLRALHACMPDTHACMQCFACFALCVYIVIILYKADAHCYQHFVCNG